MKQVNVTVSFDEEKLTALKRYMGKRDLEPEAELSDALVKLYEKYVPAPVREYIDENDVTTGTARSRRGTKPAAPKLQAQKNEESAKEAAHHEQP